MVIVADQASRLQGVYQLILLVQLPVEWCGILVAVPPAVEPYRAYLSVAGQQFFKLGIHEVVVVRPVCFLRVFAGSSSGASHRIVVAGPVYVRVVEVQTYALFLAFIGEFLQHITAERRGVHYVVVALCGVPHRESVVVSRRDAYILCSCVLYGRYPGFGVERAGIESGGSLGVFVAVKSVVQIPLALSEHAVDAPMYEHAETRVLEFLT